MRKINLDKKSIALILIIVLTATASFGLGRLSIVEQYRDVSGAEVIVPKLTDLKIDESGFSYVASKNGTKYYPIGCKSAGRIKPENRVYFTDVGEAEDSGLTPTSTC